ALGTMSMAFGGELEQADGGTVSRTRFPKGNMYRSMVEAFQEAVRQGGEPDASGLDGLRCIEITRAAFEAARTGRAVRLSGD
ncbi:MAG: hypothetical protein AAB502_11785, partial [Chloroflexota bacterium]